MDTIITFEDLSRHFTEKLINLSEAVAIQASLENTMEDEQFETAHLMESLWHEIDELSMVLTLIRSKCADQRKVLSGVQATKQKVQSLLKELHYTENNVPPHLPLAKTVSDVCTVSSLPYLVPQDPKSIQVEPSSSGTKNTTTLPADRNCQSRKTTNIQQVPYPYPTIQYLTVDEFENVPKYMKGRLSYQQVNSVVDELNKTLKAKYSLLRHKRTTLSDAQRERYDTLKSQETKETKGLFFIVEADLKDWSSLKLGKETRSIFPILRHCSRLCEIRGGGILRLALLETY